MPIAGEIAVPEALEADLCAFLAQLKKGARLLTYAPLRDMYGRHAKASPFPFKDHGKSFMQTTWCDFNFCIYEKL